jgi:hypothetical protein
MRPKPGQTLDEFLAEEFSPKMKAESETRPHHERPPQTEQPKKKRNRGRGRGYGREARREEEVIPGSTEVITDRRELLGVLGPLAAEMGIAVSSVNGGKAKRQNRG